MRTWNHVVFVLMLFASGIANADPFAVSLGEQCAMRGKDVFVPIILDASSDAPLIGSLNLLIGFDTRQLRFNSATAGQALLDHHWGYWAYRLESTRPGRIRIRAMAIPSLNHPLPDSANPTGLISQLNFQIARNRLATPFPGVDTIPIRFCWDTPTDNLVVLRRDSTRVSAVEFRNGTIRTYSEPRPGGHDITLNRFNHGWPQSDPDVLASFLIFGDTSAIDRTYYEAQLAAADLDGDGSPFTVADLVHMAIALPRATPCVAEPESTYDPHDTVFCTLKTDPGEASVGLASNSDIGAVIFYIGAPGVDTLTVSPTDAARDMTLTYHLSDSLLRVILYSSSVAMIPAGAAELLTVTTDHADLLRIRSIQAAAFNGELLEASW